MSAWGLYSQHQDVAAPANQRGEIIRFTGTLRQWLTHLDSVPFFLFYGEAKCGRWAVTLPDSPENVLLVDENTAGSLTSLTAGEINRVATTQLPTAATTAVCQPRQMHKRRPHPSNMVVALAFFVGIYNTQSFHSMSFVLFWIFFILKKISIVRNPARWNCQTSPLWF